MKYYVSIIIDGKKVDTQTIIDINEQRAAECYAEINSDPYIKKMEVVVQTKKNEKGTKFDVELIWEPMAIVKKNNHENN